MLKRALFPCLFFCATLLAACADMEEPETPGEVSEAVQGGTACGPNGLVCSGQQICCVTDPLPPAPARYTCISKKQACNP